MESVKKSWSDAQQSCKTLCPTDKKDVADLVSVTSEAIEIKMLELANNEMFWTGGNDIDDDEKTFVWSVDKTPFWVAPDGPVTGTYSNWYSTANVQQPNHADGQNCVKYNVKKDDSGNLLKAGWDDVNWGTELVYACEYSIK